MSEKDRIPKELVGIARAAIAAGLDGEPYVPPKLAPPWDKTQGVFVTLFGPGKQLRGCIGHITGVCATLAEEIAQCALAAAFEDPRFPPLTHAEFARISLEVSLLGPVESGVSASDLDPSKWGVVVSSGNRKGLLLPDIEGVETVAAQVDIARRKAGISPNEPVTLHRFRVEKVREDH